MSAAGITYTVGANVSGAISAFNQLKGTLGGITSSVAGFAGKFAMIAAPLAGLGAGIGGVALAGKALGAAMDTETLTSSFKALLKDADLAKGLVADLMQFSDETPFSPEAVAAAGKQMVAFGFAASDVKGLLKDAGDLAAGMGKPIEQVADAFGRVKAGDFGAAFEGLRNLGVSRAELEGAGLQFDKNGTYQGSVEQAMEGVRSVIQSRFGGAMDELSQTTGGKLSTLQGKITAMFRAFGEPILSQLGPFLDMGIELAGTLAAKATTAAQYIVASAQALVEMFQAGNLGAVAADALQYAFATAANFAWKTLNGVFSLVGQLLVEQIKNAVTLFSIITTGDFWKGLGSALLGAFQSAIGTLQTLLAGLVERFKPLFEAVGKGYLVEGAAEGLRDAGESNRDAAGKNFGNAQDFLTPAFEKASARLAETAKNVSQAYAEGFANTADVIDTSGMGQEVSGLISDITARVGTMQTEVADSTTRAAEAMAAASTAAVETVEEAPEIAPASGGGPAQADRLAQIGGFVGGGAANPQKTLEDNTAKTAKAAEQTATGTKELARLADRSTTATERVVSAVEKLPDSLAAVLEKSGSGVF